MSDTLRKPRDAKPRVGYGYVGVWSDGTLGWCMPKHVSSHDKDVKSARRYVHKVDATEWNTGSQSYLCRITIAPVRDSRGRFIVRRIKP